MANTGEEQLHGYLAYGGVVAMVGGVLAALLNITLLWGVGIAVAVAILVELSCRWKVAQKSRLASGHPSWATVLPKSNPQDEEHRRKEEEELRRKEEELAAQVKWKAYHESKTMADIGKMSGTQFEEFLARLFARMGYTEIRLTETNDQGGDLLCLSPSGVRLVIQAKRWRNSVGNGAVQELLGAMLFYDRDEGMVVTNSTFTVAAIKLAGKQRRRHKSVPCPTTCGSGRRRW